VDAEVDAGALRCVVEAAASEILPRRSLDQARRCRIRTCAPRYPHLNASLGLARLSSLLSRACAPHERDSFKQRDQGVLFGSHSTSHRGICGIESARLYTNWFCAIRVAKLLGSETVSAAAIRRLGSSVAPHWRKQRRISSSPCCCSNSPVDSIHTRQSESLGGLRAREWRLLRTFDQQHDAESDLEDMLPVLEEQYIPHAKHDLDREAIDE